MPSPLALLCVVLAVLLIVFIALYAVEASKNSRDDSDSANETPEADPEPRRYVRGYVPNPIESGCVACKVDEGATLEELVPELASTIAVAREQKVSPVISGGTQRLLEAFNPTGVPSVTDDKGLSGIIPCKDDIDLATYLPELRLRLTISDDNVSYVRNRLRDELGINNTMDWQLVYVPPGIDLIRSADTGAQLVQQPALKQGKNVLLCGDLVNAQRLVTLISGTRVEHAPFHYAAHHIACMYLFRDRHVLGAPTAMTRVIDLLYPQIEENTPSIGAFYQCYKQPNAFYHSLSSYRAVYPEGSLVVVSDGGYDYTHVAKHFDAKSYTHSRHIGNDITTTFRTEDIVPYLERFVGAAKQIKDDYFFLLEDDTMVYRRLKGPIPPQFDMVAMSKGDPESDRFYGGCGGTIFRTAFFAGLDLDTLASQVDKFDELNTRFNPGLEFSDGLLDYICRVNGGKVTGRYAHLTSEMTETRPGTGDPIPAIMHTFKEHYDIECSQHVFSKFVGMHEPMGPPARRRIVERLVVVCDSPPTTRPDHMAEWVDHYAHHGVADVVVVDGRAQDYLRDTSSIKVLPTVPATAEPGTWHINGVGLDDFVWSAIDTSLPRVVQSLVDRYPETDCFEVPVSRFVRDTPGFTPHSIVDSWRDALVVDTAAAWKDKDETVIKIVSTSGGAATRTVRLPAVSLGGKPLLAVNRYDVDPAEITKETKIQYNYALAWTDRERIVRYKASLKPDDSLGDVTYIITACGRPDLLKTTLESIGNFNTYQGVREMFIVEDSGVHGVNDFALDMDIGFPIHLVYNRVNIGQIKSLDKVLSLVKTSYCMSGEEDFEFFKPGFIEAAMGMHQAATERGDKLVTTWLRAHDDTNYHPFVENSDPGLPYHTMSTEFRAPHNDPKQPDLKELVWSGFTMNPGLRTRDSYFAVGRLWQDLADDPATERTGEYQLNTLYNQLGFIAAIGKQADGFVRHIGHERHVESGGLFG